MLFLAHLRTLGCRQASRQRQAGRQADGHLDMLAYMDRWIEICVPIHTYTHIHTRTHAHPLTQTDTHTHGHTSNLAYIITSTHTHTHTHTNTILSHGEMFVVSIHIVE